MQGRVLPRERPLALVLPSAVPPRDTHTAHDAPPALDRLVAPDTLCHPIRSAGNPGITPVAPRFGSHSQLGRRRSVTCQKLYARHVSQLIVRLAKYVCIIRSG
jgi:hypothetical protein